MKKTIWEKCVAFHGHECGGLTIGYKAALYAAELLSLNLEDSQHGICISDDEQLVCIAENDACGIDAIQVILGCSMGKGNLLLRIRGKQAFSFYNRTTGESVRLVLKRVYNMTRAEAFAHYKRCEPKDLFDVKETKIRLPEPARIFESYVCDRCGETAGANWIRLQKGEKLCLDCYGPYSRFDV